VNDFKNMRQSYLAFNQENKKGYAVSSQLSWTHYRTLMRVEDLLDAVAL
jgi:hypothetical protein